MGRPADWMKELTGRSPMKSPGAPSHRREIQRNFWTEIATGSLPEECAHVVGVSQAVGGRWFRHGGGMPPMSLKPLSGRYLSFAEREEIALRRAEGASMRQVARELANGAAILTRAVVDGAVLIRAATSGMCRTASQPRHRRRAVLCGSPRPQVAIRHPSNPRMTGQAIPVGAPSAACSWLRLVIPSLGNTL